MVQGGFKEAALLLVGWKCALYCVQGGDEAVIARPRLWPWISGSEDEGGLRDM
jgi:hypothetical protein